MIVLISLTFRNQIQHSWLRRSQSVTVNTQRKRCFFPQKEGNDEGMKSWGDKSKLRHSVWGREALAPRWFTGTIMQFLVVSQKPSGCPRPQRRGCRRRPLPSTALSCHRRHPRSRGVGASAGTRTWTFQEQQRVFGRLETRGFSRAGMWRQTQACSRCCVWVET